MKREHKHWRQASRCISPSRSSRVRSCAWSTTLRTIVASTAGYGCSSRTRCMMSDPSSGSVSASSRTSRLVDEIEIPDDLAQMPPAQRRQLLRQQIRALVIHREGIENRLAIRDDTRAPVRRRPVENAEAERGSASLCFGGRRMRSSAPSRYTGVRPVAQ